MIYFLFKKAGKGANKKLSVWSFAYSKKHLAMGGWDFLYSDHPVPYSMKGRICLFNCCVLAASIASILLDELERINGSIMSKTSRNIHHSLTIPLFAHTISSCKGHHSASSSSSAMTYHNHHHRHDHTIDTVPLTSYYTAYPQPRDPLRISQAKQATNPQVQEPPSSATRF